MNRRLSLLLPLLACGPLAAAHGQEPAQKPIRVAVEMVSLPVTVLTRSGNRVVDLTREDFQVYEDRVIQKIESFSAVDEPFSVALLLDTSGSTMLQLERIQREAVRFTSLLGSGNAVAVVTFADEVTLQQDFTTDRARINAAIHRTRPGGYTVLYEAVWLAFEEVVKSAPQRCAVVMLSDGVDTASDKATRAETRELAKESRAPAYCIYFNTRPEMQGDPRRTIPGATNPPAGGRPPMTLPVPGVGSSTEDYMGGRQYLSDLADYSGGKVFEALRMEDLTPAYDAIARELSSQYSIGYYPTNLRHDGKYRRIDVKVSRPGLYVQTRAGYYAPDDTRKQKK